MIKDYLRSAGINTKYDLDDLKAGEPKSPFMAQISSAQCVVVLFTPLYKERLKDFDSGVSFEVRLLANRLVREGPTFYTPIILEGSARTSIPECLEPIERLYYDLTNWNNRYDVIFTALHDKLLGPRPQLVKVRREFEAALGIKAKDPKECMRDIEGSVASPPAGARCDVEGNSTWFSGPSLVYGSRPSVSPAASGSPALGGSGSSVSASMPLPRSMDDALAAMGIAGEFDSSRTAPPPARDAYRCSASQRRIFYNCPR
jgi:hypothetical protein